MLRLKQKYRIIGVDLDDVLLNFADPFISFNNLHYGTTHRREQITSFLMEDIWGITGDEVNRRIRAFYHCDTHKHALPIEGAIEGIKKLADTHELHIVSSKSAETSAYMTDWLRKHFPNAFRSVHFTRNDQDDKHPREKANICKELGVEVFIDDALRNAEKIAAVSIPVLLYDTPWNQGPTPPLVTRVYSWQEIVAHIRK
jgi:uncharacterized HAD superfamily protein